MKRILSLLLVAVMLFALCACGETKTTAQEQTPAPVIQEKTEEIYATTTPQPAQKPADASSADSQLELIYKNFNALKMDDGETSFYYSVTDLDHNGLLELLAAVTEGTGSFTRGKFLEVNHTYDGFNEINLNLAQGKYLPEVITSKVDTYQDGDTYSYIFTDSSDKNSTEHYSTTESLSLKKCALTITPLCYQDIEVVNGYSATAFYNGNGEMITPSEYDEIPAKAFASAKKSTTNFGWMTAITVTSIDALKGSYTTFLGETAPVAPVTPASPAPAPQPTVAPQPKPTMVIVDSPVVTKDPTSETLEAGKSCCFVSRATNAGYQRWKIIDLYGNVYDAESTPFCYTMYVLGANTQQLTLSNVPIDMNGWKVRCDFTGANNITVCSATATVYVTQPKISTPITAYPGTGYYFNDLYNYVTLYADAGAQIHYELIKSGDTGAYDSGTVISGQSVPVIGIEGQYITVSLYANVVGDDGNSLYAAYSVDRTPIQPTPTPDPTYNSCRGYVVDELMSTCTIDIFAGSTIQVVKDIVSPQGSSLMGRGCTVYYYGVDPTNTSNVYSVIMDP